MLIPLADDNRFHRIAGAMSNSDRIAVVEKRIKRFHKSPPLIRNRNAWLLGSSPIPQQLVMVEGGSCVEGVIKGTIEI